jgi:hypothetical protein
MYVLYYFSGLGVVFLRAEMGSCRYVYNRCWGIEGAQALSFNSSNLAFMVGGEACTQGHNKELRAEG